MSKICSITQKILEFVVKIVGFSIAKPYSLIYNCSRSGEKWVKVVEKSTI